MIQNLLVIFLTSAILLGLSACGKSKSRKDTVAQACTSSSCEVLPGQVAPSTYTRYPYGWAGPIVIEDSRAFATFLRSVSPNQFCTMNGERSWYRMFDCEQLADIAKDADVAGNAVYDGTMFIGVDRLEGNPLGEVGLNLVKNPYSNYSPGNQGVGGGAPTWTPNGYRTVGQLGPQDLYSGRFTYSAQTQDFRMSVRSQARDRVRDRKGRVRSAERRRFDFVVKTLDIAQNEIDVEIYVDDAKAASAHLWKGFDYRSQQTFNAPYTNYNNYNY